LIADKITTHAPHRPYNWEETHRLDEHGGASWSKQLGHEEKQSIVCYPLPFSHFHCLLKQQGHLHGDAITAIRAPPDFNLFVTTVLPARRRAVIYEKETTRTKELSSIISHFQRKQGETEDEKTHA
jgi:hypothetical protein